MDRLLAADIYRHTFAARHDAYAAFHENWVCVREEMTPEVIVSAFGGGPSVSTYLIGPDNMSHVGALDFDTEDGWEMASRVRDEMGLRGVTAYIEPSRRGAHLWVILDWQLAAKSIRRGLRGFLSAAGLPDDPKIEIRPSHDEIKPGGYGSPLRLPTMPHPVTGLRYPLCDAANAPLSADIATLVGQIDLTDSRALYAMADLVRPVPKDAKRGDLRPYMGPTDKSSISDMLRDLFGVMNAAPGRTVRCPIHGDKRPSLSIYADDERAMCKSPSCPLNNNDRGVGTILLRRLAPARVGGLQPH